MRHAIRLTVLLLPEALERRAHNQAKLNRHDEIEPWKEKEFVR
jgi:hypothetical protein